LLTKEKDMALYGKVAVITGGAGGIGRATSLQLAKDGAAISIWDIDTEGAQETARLIQNGGGRATAYETDVASAASVTSAVARTRKDLGPITILVNNAALTGSSRFEDMTEETWDRMIEVDLKGPFLCTKAVLPDMLVAGWGRIVNITSSSAQMGTPYMAHYVAAKGGLMALTKALAMEYASRGITINNIPPGYVDTPTLRRNQANYAGGARKFDESVASFPMKRAGKPEDIAAACSYLVSEAAGYVTGQTLSVNGGRFLS
jgi:2-hydroxycyclohexanecarboxyl-CoA dehydrogenase